MKGPLNMKDKQVVLMFGIRLQPKFKGDVNNKFLFVSILVLREKWDCLLHSGAGIGLKKRKKQKKRRGRAGEQREPTTATKQQQNISVMFNSTF